MRDLERQLNERTRLVAVGYASNAVGTVNNIAEIVKLARSVGAWVFVDAVHYAPINASDTYAGDDERYGEGTYTISASGNTATVTANVHNHIENESAIGIKKTSSLRFQISCLPNRFEIKNKAR
jgi:hypothetical protein